MVPSASSKKPALRHILLGLVVLAALGLFCGLVLLPIYRFVAPAFLPLPEVLRRAQFVTIHRNGYSVSDPPKLSAHENPKVLSWLSACADHPVPPPRAKPDYTFYINIHHVTVHTFRYGYVSATGQIGSGSAWRQTPPEFQSWMRALSAKPWGRAAPPPPEPGDSGPVVISAPKS